MSAAGQKIATALAQYGRAMVLRRRVGTTAAFTEVQVHGVTRVLQPLRGSGGSPVDPAQADAEVTIGNAEIEAAGWPGPPRKGDQLVIDGQPRNILGSETKYLGSEALSHVLWVKG